MNGTMIPPSWPVRAIHSLPFGSRLCLRLYNRVLMHVSPSHRVRTYFGAEMDCDVRDMIQATILHFRVWEPNSSHVFERLLRPGDVVADVGANVGYYSLLFSKLVGDQGKVLAVEALPRLAEGLADTLARNGATNVHVANVAVGPTVGTQVVYEAPATNVGMTTTRADRGYPAAAVVDALPLTHLLSDEDAARTALIKIDIEGAEIPVVEDIIDNIDRFPAHLAIAVEIAKENRDEWLLLFERFEQLGFHAYDLETRYDWHELRNDPAFEPQRISELPTEQTDALFTRRALPERGAAPPRQHLDDGAPR